MQSQATWRAWIKKRVWHSLVELTRTVGFSSIAEMYTERNAAHNFTFNRCRRPFRIKVHAYYRWHLWALAMIQESTLYKDRQRWEIYICFHEDFNRTELWKYRHYDNYNPTSLSRNPVADNCTASVIGHLTVSRSAEINYLQTKAVRQDSICDDALTP